MTTWLHLFTWNTWQEFLDTGGTITGFRASRWKTAQKIQRGDRFICYMIGISRFFAILEVTGEAYQDDTPIWSEVLLPSRVPVKIIMDLPPEFAVPVRSLSQNLSYFQNLAHPQAWSGHFRTSPLPVNATDADIVIEALTEALDNPVFLEYDRRQLERSRIPVYETKAGGVTVPESMPLEPVPPPEKPPLTHEEIQWRLLDLGGKMGLDVWVAKNDWGRRYNGQVFKEMPRVRRELPVQFDEATNRTIEVIDVLWLKENAIVAAFEVEHTSAVYSGLLRMADLISMQPNINIDLYIVAPDERREKVRTEINRPTFSRLKPPLQQICRFIPYSSLVARLEQLGDMLPYIRPEFLDDFAETLDVELL